MWYSYKDLNKDLKLSKAEFRKAINTLNYNLMMAVIRDGKLISLNEGGKLHVMRIRRTNKSINWGKSVKGDNGKYKKLVYYTPENSPYYFMIYWRKPSKNPRSLFPFFKYITPEGRAGDKTNYKKKLSLQLKEDPYANVKYYQLTILKKIEKLNLQKEIELVYEDASLLPDHYDLDVIKDNAEKNKPVYGFYWNLIYQS